MGGRSAPRFVHAVRYLTCFKSSNALAFVWGSHLREGLVEQFGLFERVLARMPRRGGRRWSASGVRGLDLTHVAARSHNPWRHVRPRASVLRLAI